MGTPRGCSRKRRVGRGGRIRLQHLKKGFDKNGNRGFGNRKAVPSLTAWSTLNRYLDEFEFRFNNRKNGYLFRDTITRLVTAEGAAVLQAHRLVKRRYRPKLGVQHDRIISAPVVEHNR